jgi:dUTPase
MSGLDGYLLPQFKFAIREDLEDTGDLFLPTKAEPTATGWDVRASIRGGVTLLPGMYIKIPLGFRAFCPEGWWFELKPRSSSFAKKSLHSLYGTIDQDFSLEVLFAAQYNPENSNATSPKLRIEFGEAIAQIIPVRRKEMMVEKISNQEFDSLCAIRNSVRKGGFGSTS